MEVKETEKQRPRLESGLAIGRRVFMGSALYDSFIADYYDESPVVKGRVQDVAFYRDAAREFGDPILELGCGTGRNLVFLSRAVGPDGRVYGIDISEGMLAKARETCEKNGCTNVRLIQSDAAEYELPELVDGAIFSLYYCTMRHRKLALRHAWEQLKSGGRLVMLDAKALSGWLGRLLYPLTLWTLKLTVLGSPDIDELKDLEALTGDVEVENLQCGTYFIARVTKPAR